MNIKKTKLPDGKEGITIYADPDVISEMVALCKQRNIPVDESPEISSETIESLKAMSRQVSVNERVVALAKALKSDKGDSLANRPESNITQDHINNYFKYKENK